MDERNLVSDVFLTPNTSSRRRNMSTGTTIKAVWCNLHAASFKQSIEPIARQVLLIGDDFGLEGGVLGEPCSGHTPGNSVIHLASMGHHGLITGDVIHHQLHLRYPSLSSRADDDRDLARVTRRALIERCPTPVDFCCRSISLLLAWEGFPCS
jgi:glyoxylase-like metal-dependent hydrolase (beta-lactamase superfamily II)